MSHDMITHPSRRRVLGRGAASLALGALGAPALIRAANAQSKFDWKRFAGQKIDVILAKTPRADIFQRYEKEFVELTGIDVSSEQIPEQQQRQKVMIEFTSGNPSFDVVNLALHVQKRIAAKGKWMEDLRPYLADPSITGPDYDFADFGKAGLNYATQADGRLDTIPIFVDYWMIFYNKELFAQKGIEYPKSLDELKVAAKALTDPSKGVYGFVSRGLKNANIPVWTSWLLGQGLETIDSSGKLLTETPEAVWAAEYYRDLNKNFAPPGTIGFNWNECQTTFMQGRAAMWLDGIGFTAPLEEFQAIQGCRQGRLRCNAAGAQGPSLRDLRRRAWHFGRVEEEAGGLALHPMGHQSGEPAALPQGGRRRAGAQFGLSGS